jgi:hypothetical protein
MKVKGQLAVEIADRGANASPSLGTVHDALDEKV